MGRRQGRRRVADRFRRGWVDRDFGLDVAGLWGKEGKARARFAKEEFEEAEFFANKDRFDADDYEVDLRKLALLGNRLRGQGLGTGGMGGGLGGLL